MIKYFDNQPEPQLGEPKRASYREKVFGMVKDMDQVEFEKRRKRQRPGQQQGRESGIRRRNHLSPPFLSRRSRFSSATCRTGKHLIHPMPSIACT
jgi:hypothetical protein